MFLCSCRFPVQESDNVILMLSYVSPKRAYLRAIHPGRRVFCFFSVFFLSRVPFPPCPALPRKLDEHSTLPSHVHLVIKSSRDKSICTARLRHDRMSGVKQITRIWFRRFVECRGCLVVVTPSGPHTHVHTLLLTSQYPTALHSILGCAVSRQVEVLTAFV